MSSNSHNLRILSLNCRRLAEVLKSLLNNKETATYDMLLLQELPYFVDKQTGFTSPHWQRLFPTNAARRLRKHRIRLCIYIKSDIPSHLYSQVHMNTLDVVCVTFNLPSLPPHFFYSVYNPPNSNSSIMLVHRHVKPLQEDAKLFFGGGL